MRLPGDLLVHTPVGRVCVGTCPPVRGAVGSPGIHWDSGGPWDTSRLGHGPAAAPESVGWAVGRRGLGVMGQVLKG